MEIESPIFRFCLSFAITLCPHVATTTNRDYRTPTFVKRNLPLNKNPEMKGG